MGIYRGPGGSGDAINDASSETRLAVEARDAAIAARVAAETAQAAAELAETHAETAETNAETAETNAETAATNASNSASSASTSATNAASSASAASTSATNAASSASSASSSASAASTSASNAATSATNASNSASTASTAATNAGNSATAAASSASSASSSASTATTQASNASTSATNAASSASSASSSASTATTQAGIATTQATNASNSASAAATSATNASNSASAASTSASNAATSATAAQTAETNAETAQAAAESARDATLAAYDSFDDRYLGVKSSDPTLDNDGNALAAGSLYFSSTDNAMKVYTGSAWVAAYVSGAGTLLAANNLSDVSSASSARTNLGLAIGTNVQAWDADLDTWATKTAPSGTVVGTSDIQTLTNKTIALGSNTVSGTLAQFNTAVTDADFASIAGTETLTNKTLTSPAINTATISGGTINNAAVGGTTPAAGAFTTLSASGAFSANGGATLGDASGDALTINSSAVSIPNGLNFDSNTLVIDATNNRTYIGASSLGLTTTASVPLFMVGQMLAGSSNTTLNAIKDFRIAGGAYANNAATIINFSGQSTDNNINYGGGTGAGEPATQHIWYTGTVGSLGSGAERMRITSTGNVGIGTSSPAAKFTVSHSINTNPTLTANAFAPVSFNNAGVELTYGVYTSSPFAAWLQTKASGGAWDLAINPLGGNVGIGTSSPAVKFHIKAATDVNYGVYSGTSILRTAAFNDAFSSFIDWQLDATSYRFNTAGSERMRLDSSGRLGIGTTSPTSGYLLDVAGGIKLSGAFDENVFAVTGTTPALSPSNGTIQTWTLSANSTPTAGTWADGESLTLMVLDGTAFTITWTSVAVTWVGGSAPTLDTTKQNVIELWKVGGVVYGALVGAA